MGAGVPFVMSGEEGARGLTCRGAGRGFVVQGLWLSGRCGGLGAALTLSQTFPPRSQARRRQRFRLPQASSLLYNHAARELPTTEGKHEIGIGFIAPLMHCAGYHACCSAPRMSLLSSSLRPKLRERCPAVIHSYTSTIATGREPVGATAAAGGSPACLARPSSSAV